MAQQDFTARSTSPLRRLSEAPRRVYMPVRGIDEGTARAMSEGAVYMARRVMPKMSGDAARRLKPFYGDGFFGIYFPDPYVWYQEQGIRPFTMHNLAGKTIPMWINDPYGKERSKNPKAKTRVTESGITQVLIFRRAAKVGTTKASSPQRSSDKKPIGSTAHFPGQPGRIATRQARIAADGSIVSTGKIAKGNVPLWWRHPGLQPRLFLNYSLTTTALMFGFNPTVVFADR